MNPVPPAPAIYPQGHGTAGHPLKIDMYDPQSTGMYVHDVCGLVAGLYGTNAGISVVADNLDFASAWQPRARHDERGHRVQPCSRTS